MNDTIRQTHVDWFGGRDRVLYKVDPVEKDAVFYLYDKGELKQWPGYCIYYEKNEEMQDFLVAGGAPSVDAGYKEPVLAELGRRVGRKEEPEESLQEPVPEYGAEVMQREESKEVKEGKGGKGGNRFGMGLAAAALLLAVGAFVLYEPEQGVLGPSATEPPVPTGYKQAEDAGDLLEASANPKTTGMPSPSGTLSGSMFEQGFAPIEEEPYVPGADHAGERAEGETPTEAVPTELPTPEVTPSEDNGVMINDTMELYIVQSGDTLAGICRRFYGDINRMEEVKGINQIPDENWIYAGQELYLP